MAMTGAEALDAAESPEEFSKVLIGIFGAISRQTAAEEGDE